MNILAAILIIGASGHATRSLESEQTIPEIIARVAIGGVKDALAKSNETRRGDVQRVLPKTTGFSLAIDNKPRTGWRSWGEAAARTIAYAADWPGGLPVGYAYRLRVHGYTIQRATSISDGHVTLTTDVWWTERVEITRRVTRRVPIHVRIVIRADESNGTTWLTGTGTGTADTSDFACPLVRRIAERQAAETLRVGITDALLGIESTGRGWHDAAELPDSLRTIGAGIRAIGRLRR